MSWRDYFRQILAEPPKPQSVTDTGAASGRSPMAASPAAPPRPSWNRAHAPSREEFAAWLNDPCTTFVFAALETAAAAQKAEWESESWGKCQANPLFLMELRTRADAYTAMQDTDYEGYCEWLGVEPEPLREETNAA